jgi:hypothetical protein
MVSIKQTVNAHQIVNGHALRTVMVRPFATVNKAMVESMKAEQGLMMQLGEKDHEMGRSWGGKVPAFIAFSGVSCEGTGIHWQRVCGVMISWEPEFWSCGINCHDAARRAVRGLMWQ